jgi:predicted DNA-binding ribbon-helix-helix protein
VSEVQGCSDHSCVWGHPGGMGTNGGCKCLRIERDPDKRIRLEKNVRAIRAQLDEARALTDCWKNIAAMDRCSVAQLMRDLTEARAELAKVSEIRDEWCAEYTKARDERDEARSLWRDEEDVADEWCAEYTKARDERDALRAAIEAHNEKVRENCQFSSSAGDGVYLITLPPADSASAEPKAVCDAWPACKCNAMRLDPKEEGCADRGEASAEPTGRCEICGGFMPRGEEMFKFHGYSGPCPNRSEEKKHE